MGALDIPFGNVCSARADCVLIKVNQLNLTEKVAADIYVKPINLLCFSIFFSTLALFFRQSSEWRV